MGAECGLIEIENNDEDEEETVELVVESVKHSLILTEGNWKQLVDISARKTTLTVVTNHEVGVGKAPFMDAVTRAMRKAAMKDT